MTQKRLVIIQTLLEALIPIIGYFYWEWGLTFILLFYALDWILAMVLYFFKCRKRIDFSQDSTEMKEFKGIFVLSLGLHGLAFILFGMAVLNWNRALRLGELIYNFLAYTEGGIPQGVFLIPLMVFAGYTQYKQQFLFAARFRNMNIRQLLNPLYIQGYVLLSVAGIFFACTFLITLPELLLIVLSILGISIYRWKFLR